MLAGKTGIINSIFFLISLPPYRQSNYEEKVNYYLPFKLITKRLNCLFYFKIKKD